MGFVNQHTNQLRYLTYRGKTQQFQSPNRFFTTCSWAMLHNICGPAKCWASYPSIWFRGSHLWGIRSISQLIQYTCFVRPAPMGFSDLRCHYSCRNIRRFSFSEPVGHISRTGQRWVYQTICSSRFESRSRCLWKSWYCWFIPDNPNAHGIAGSKWASNFPDQTSETCSRWRLLERLWETLEAVSPLAGHSCW